ncbi:MAG: RHS repeat-associated core domain-containing protein [Candidatus Thermoplasmatota archaeon]|nr:RHS repeat-associated core domain-containing protein [Candidatus Thermoplasmatota archaeon]
MKENNGENVKVDHAEQGGAYQIFVAEDNSSVYVRLITNEVIRTDDDFLYIFYTYPRKNRLTAVTYPDGTQTQYQYDLRNNLVQTTQLSGGTITDTTYSDYDIENRLLSSGNTTYEYDNNGNMILGNTNYRYYSTFLNGYKVNQLVSVGAVGGPGPGPDPCSVSGGDTLLASSSLETQESTPATSYGYALDGRRVGKAGAVDMKYLYDGENVVYELWDDKTVRFTHPIPISSGCIGCGPGNAIFFTDHPISISIDGVKYYYLYDGLGSVTELIDEYENVVNFYRYTPFGDALIREETVYNPHQFTGRQYDAESGLYHYRARAYSADIGRFMQQDPCGDGGRGEYVRVLRE